MSFVESFIKTSPEPIHLIQCKDEEGSDCFYFVMCKPHKLQALKQADEAIIDISAYGKIVHSDFGTQPSTEDLDYMAQNYGYQPL